MSDPDLLTRLKEHRTVGGAPVAEAVDVSQGLHDSMALLLHSAVHQYLQTV